MSLASQIETDVDSVFFNIDDFAVNVTYSRGGHAITVKAIVDPVFYDNEQSLGFTRIETRGYLIQADDLFFGDAVTLPLAGDKIREGGRTYIIPKSQDRPRYEYADENRLVLRVFTTFLNEQ